MVKRFFSRKFPVFGTVAMVILCLVCFLVPFALRGARLAINDMQNNVADWLPDHFPETQDLKEFRRYFVGDQFVVVSGEWCKEGEGAYINLRRKLVEESLDYESVLGEMGETERIRAQRKGDELGLLYTGNYHEDWGEEREKWLLGKEGQWFFINRHGALYRWEGQNNVIEGVKRSLEKALHGKNRANGTFVDKFGEPPDDEKGVPNEFYADPRKLCARPFKSITTGPDIFDKMVGENGTLRIGKYDEDDAETFEARIEAHKRLTGALFGPTPEPTFQWTFESLLQHIEDKDRLAQLQSDTIHRDRFEEFLRQIIEERFDGEFSNLVSAPQAEKLEIWYRMWEDALNMPAPPRQTCLIVTLNDPVIKELDRAVGRPLLGKPRGRILELATGECGISPDNLHIGGPPSDNVAIDEEGTSTLLRLVSLCALIGVSLSWFSFRSFRVTFMLFFVGGVAAISSLSYVWFGGSTLDAILMTMPSLVFVLGLSGAVHVVNYYRDACHEDGPDLAVETAVKHGLFPCTLAAFTTALGLVSLYASTITPIKKFGLFSAIAVVATVVLLFTYLPAALTIWPPGYGKKSREEKAREGGLSALVAGFWRGIGDWVIRRWAIVATVCLLAMIGFGYGISHIRTSVHLLKLFDPSAKILQDYRWMEENLGKLVPAEVVVGFDLDTQQEFYREKQQAVAESSGAEKADIDVAQEELKYMMLERMELSYRVRKQLEKFFGPDGLDIVGSGMSTDVFVPIHKVESQISFLDRQVYNKKLYDKRQEMLDEQYLAVASDPDTDELLEELDLATSNGDELWRISIRLAALNNVDYGQFVNDLKSLVEPILSAYEHRTKILRSLQEKLGEGNPDESRILVLGRPPALQEPEVEKRIAKQLELAQELGDEAPIAGIVDQTYLFTDTLQALLENRGYEFYDPKNRPSKNKWQRWLYPENFSEEKPFKTETMAKFLETGVDCVVLIDDSPRFDEEFIRQHASNVIDCREHQFEIDPRTKLPIKGLMTAKERADNGEDVGVTAIYTGIIPIVYKAQNQLLTSLIKSIELAFVMIALVMMLLLRDWSRPASPTNLLNISGGMISMLPNVFPIVIIFGFMGLRGIKVDIGSMMTASVAMGVAVDDTIHFLNWYRSGLQSGMKRYDAIRMAYERVATAMTQTTLIGGLGLFAFALSTFTPTQRFGTLMLFLLLAALVGDLIFLPAILASPLGRFFGRELDDAGQQDLDEPSLNLIVGPDQEATLPEIHPDSLKHLELDKIEGPQSDSQTG